MQDNNQIEIKSSPVLIAIILGACILIGVLLLAMGKLKWLDFGLFILPATILFCTLEYKYTVFDMESSSVVIKTFFPLKQSINTLSFYDIKSVEIVTGKGQRSHRGYVRLSTDRNAFACTSQGALNQRELEVLVEKIQLVLSQSVAPVYSSFKRDA